MAKRLYKSNKNKVIFGICGGLGEYFDIDPVFIRLIFVFLLIVTGFIPGIIFYLIAGLIIPKKLHY